MDWLNSRLDQLQKLGGGAFGSVKNKVKSPFKSSWKTGVVGKAASDLKIGGKGFKFGPEQANSLIGILGPVVSLLQQRRRR